MSIGPAEQLRRPRSRLFGIAFVGLMTACSSVPPLAPPSIMPAVQAPPQPAAEVVAPPAPPAPPPVLSGHIASFRTLAEAETAWPRLIERFPPLRDEPKRFIEIDLGPQRGKVVRLLVGGFANLDQTSQFCHKLKNAGAYCAPHELPPENL